MFSRVTPDGVVWPDDSATAVDAIIWCTGFRAALDYLNGLGILGSDGRVAVSPQDQALGETRLWLLGFGDWTGFASATLIWLRPRSARNSAGHLGTRRRIAFIQCPYAPRDRLGTRARLLPVRPSFCI